MDVKIIRALKDRNVSLTPKRRRMPASVQVASLVSAQVRGSIKNEKV